MRTFMNKKLKNIGMVVILTWLVNIFVLFVICPLYIRAFIKDGIYTGIAETIQLFAPVCITIFIGSLYSLFLFVQYFWGIKNPDKYFPHLQKINTLSALLENKCSKFFITYCAYKIWEYLGVIAVIFTVIYLVIILHPVLIWLFILSFFIPLCKKHI